MIKILRNKFKEEICDMYTKNYKTVLKDTKENLNKWKDILYS